MGDVDTAITLLEAGAQPDPPAGSEVESPRVLAFVTGRSDLLGLFALSTPPG